MSQGPEQQHRDEWKLMVIEAPEGIEGIGEGGRQLCGATHLAPAPACFVVVMCFDAPWILAADPPGERCRHAMVRVWQADDLKDPREHQLRIVLTNFKRIWSTGNPVRRDPCRCLWALRAPPILLFTLQYVRTTTRPPPRSGTRAP